MTTVLRDPSETRALCDRARKGERRVAFVPTMGALHEGHRALIRTAKKGNAFVVVSIFVNPLQFGPSEDFGLYPRSFELDVDLCREERVDVVFAPDTPSIYPPDFSTAIEVHGALTSMLEGAHRPSHFRGVTTIVGLLFHIVGPCTAVLGRKDYQQWKVIERMVRDLRLPVTILAHPTVRERDGLARSSRNQYLNLDARLRARAIPEALQRACNAFALGEREPNELTRLVREHVEPVADRIDYIELVDAETLGPPWPEKPMVLAIAARIAGTRLIDNVVLGREPGPLDGEAPPR